MKTNNINDIKSIEKYQVISAKIPGSLFDEIERFRSDSQSNTRSEAIISLITCGLRANYHDGSVPEYCKKCSLGRIR